MKKYCQKFQPPARPLQTEDRRICDSTDPNVIANKLITIFAVSDVRLHCL